MKETEVEVGGHTYQIGHLNVFDQLTVVKRLGPLLASLLKTGESVRGGGPAEENVGAVLVRVLPQIAEGFSKLPDEDLLYVVKKCLSVISRQEGPAWKRIVAAGNTQQLMYADIELPQMMELSWAVIQSSLDQYFPSPAPKSQASA